MHLIPRAFVRQNSGRLLNLLDPDPTAWTNEDLATGLSRTYRWGGHSVWPLPLSVAQHSLTVVAILRRLSPTLLTPTQALRELLHDADEALIGGFDAIQPLKSVLGPNYAQVVEGLTGAVFRRYRLPMWTPDELRLHKRADHLAAASEAIHVAGWSVAEMHELLNIGLKPLEADPLADLYGCKPWKPWPPRVAARRFLDALNEYSLPASRSPTEQPGIALTT